MTSIEQKAFFASRVHGSASDNLQILRCSICHEILWKPVACQSCDTSFCSSCINRWLVNNPNKCPRGCEIYTERKCHPAIVTLLSQLQVACFYQKNCCPEVVPYEALDKHEQECGYQPQQCPGCRSKILKKEFNGHVNSCQLIELTCDECKLMYRGCETTTKHTENICLRRQLQEMKEQSKTSKIQIEELNRRLDKICSIISTSTMVTITFDDLLSTANHCHDIPYNYKGFQWTGISYAHKSYLEANHPHSECVSSFTTDSSQNIAYFDKEGSISVEHGNQIFTLVSLSACAAWHDNLQLTISAYRKSTQVHSHDVIFMLGRPQHITLLWDNIDKVMFNLYGGMPHAGSGRTADRHLILTQVVIDALARR